MSTPSNQATQTRQNIQPKIYSLHLASSDYVHISSLKFLEELDYDNQALLEFRQSWDNLAEDKYMADGGRYRLRRHATFRARRSGGSVEQMPHQPHFQTTNFNGLNGGVYRHFEPVLQETYSNTAFRAILSFCSQTFGTVTPLNDWHVEIHQFRILAQETGGRPTPEGVHQDGVDFVFMMLINRENVIGGETVIKELNGVEVARFTLMKPMEAVLVNDLRVAHGVSPIFAANPARPAYRDMLVVTFKRI